MSSRDDSNRDNKTYANSHLFFFLEAKTLKCLHNNTEAQHTYKAFLFFIYLQHIHFIEIWVTGMADYLSDSLLILVNRFIFIAKQTFIKSFDVFRN